MNYAWTMHGLSMEYMHGLRMIMYGLCMDSERIMLEYEWIMYGICMEYAWIMQGICMD